MAYNSILMISSGDDQADGATLTKLCRSFVDAHKKLYLLYIGEHPVTGFGSMTARHHIANDMQIKQEMFPRLKRLCEHWSIPPDRIFIRFGNRSLAIERFVEEHCIDMLAIGSGLVAGKPRLVKTLTRLLEQADCDLHITL